MMMSPLRILMLYRHEGLVQTHALYSIEAPWLPKSESGTRSPSPHLRHRGNAFSTKSPPSFTLEGFISRCTLHQPYPRKDVSFRGASASASASPQQDCIHAVSMPYLFYHNYPCSVSRDVKNCSFSYSKVPERTLFWEERTQISSFFGVSA